jgi:hypothetical protein
MTQTAQAIITEETAAKTLEEYLTVVPSRSFLIPSTVKFVTTETIKSAVVKNK